MAAKTFQVTIVTPDGKTYDHPATMLVMHTSDGERGIMANHLPVIGALSIGALRLKHEDSGDADDVIAVNGGFVEFKDNVATIIADSAELPEDIDVSRAQNAKKRAEEMIERAKLNHDMDSLGRAEVHLKRAINRLQISKTPDR